MPITSRSNDRERDIDALDLNLIRALQANGRASVYELARTLGVSRDLISRRLNTLLGTGGLRVVAALSPNFAGLHVLIHAAVQIDGEASPIAEQIAAYPDTVFVSHVAGTFPIAFESRHRNIGELHTMLDHIRSIPQVRCIRINSYDALLKEFVTASAAPEPRMGMSLDTIDHELIAILQENGRTSYRGLADAVLLSPSSTRTRVKRLVEAGVIRIAAISSGCLSRNRVAIGLGISLRGDPMPVREHLMCSPAIDLAARVHGNYDFIATAVGAVSADILQVVEKIRSLPDVGWLETWVHLDIIKEDYTRTLGRALH